jgi:hypothetical protein
MNHSMIDGMTRRTLAAAGLALLVATSSALAQQAPARIRGTVEAVDGAMLTIKSRDGKSYMVKMADNAPVRAVVKMSLSDIKAGSFIGVTGMPQADGTQKALEVHIFPEAMRGTGEGHRPWDLQPTSTMTNANVETLVTSNDGQSLTMKYKDGEKKVLVPPGTPIVTYAPGDKSELKPGAVVFINAPVMKGETLEAAAVTVGRDGVNPPM